MVRRDEEQQPALRTTRIRSGMHPDLALAAPLPAGEPSRRCDTEI
jgi:hypothetical protein